MNTPKDKTELRRFFGMCNYVSKFIPGYSEKTAIIRELLRDDTERFWDKQHDCAFNELKQCISSPPVLAYYNCYVCHRKKNTAVHRSYFIHSVKQVKLQNNIIIKS